MNTKNKVRKELLVGITIGIIANIAGVAMYIFLFSKLSMRSTLENALKHDFLGSLIALGAVLNLLAFFIFIKQNKMYQARGTLIATIIAAIIILVSKFN